MAAAPAPLIPTPVVPDAPTAMEAATERASIVGLAVAVRVIPPVVVSK